MMNLCLSPWCCKVDVKCMFVLLKMINENLVSLSLIAKRCAKWERTVGNMDSGYNGVCQVRFEM